jgi:hypothetical protein
MSAPLAVPEGADEADAQPSGLVEPRPARARLTARVVPRHRLAEAEIERMLALMHVCYEGVDTARFRADLAEKQDVILVCVHATGELVGFSTVRRAKERFGGRTTEVIFSGDTIMHPAHWGSKALQAAFSRFVLARKLRRPWRPVLWFLLSGGYKTYLLMVRNLPRAWPRSGEEPPPGWRDFVDGLAARWFGAQFDARLGVVRFIGPHYRVRRGVAPIDDDARRVPEIAFFAAQNPGHAQGDELVCLAELRARDLLRILARIASRRLAANFGRIAGVIPGRTV